MARIMEDAGGSASTGNFKGGLHRILDLKPTSIHEKCPVIIGCNRDVDRVLAHYK
jgi:fructose-1,6-bisphosphatase I